MFARMFWTCSGTANPIGRARLQPFQLWPQPCVSASSGHSPIEQVLPAGMEGGFRCPRHSCQLCPAMLGSLIAFSPNYPSRAAIDFAFCLAELPVLSAPLILTTYMELHFHRMQVTHQISDIAISTLGQLYTMLHSS